MLGEERQNPGDFVGLMQQFLYALNLLNSPWLHSMLHELAHSVILRPRPGGLPRAREHHMGVASCRSRGGETSASHCCMPLSCLAEAVADSCAPS